MFLQTSDIGFIPFEHFNNLCHITFQLHIYDLILMSAGEGDSGGGTGKLVTAVRECVLALRVIPHL